MKYLLLVFITSMTNVASAQSPTPISLSTLAAFTTPVQAYDLPAEYKATGFEVNITHGPKKETFVFIFTGENCQNPQYRYTLSTLQAGDMVCFTKVGIVKGTKKMTLAPKGFVIRGR